MQRINVMFGNDILDVDILIVPDHVADNIDDITQSFFEWMSNKGNSHEYWIKNSRGECVLALGTDAFLWWLNNHYITTKEFAHMHEQHTRFCAEYQTAEF